MNLLKIEICPKHVFLRKKNEKSFLASGRWVLCPQTFTALPKKSSGWTFYAGAPESNPDHRLRNRTSNHYTIESKSDRIFCAQAIAASQQSVDSGLFRNICPCGFCPI